MKKILTPVLFFALLHLTQAQNDRDVPRTARDQVILDDLIVEGSNCVGFDCVNGENFGFETIRLKENNLRIRFWDTSNSASFPKRDWELQANETTNGGAEKFSIFDVDAGRTPFTVRGNADNNALYIATGGKIGFGTSTPVVELHAVDGDSPTLRLEQDGSSGFTAQTWDLASNETNFFIRDVTNGSKLPFRIRPNAPTSSIDVAGTTGNVGIGTASPAGRLHVDNGANETRVIMEYDDQAVSSGGYGEAVFRESGSDKWSFGAASTTNGGRFYIFDYSSTRQALAIGTDGNVGIGASSTPAADLDINVGGTFSRVDAGATQFTASSSRALKDNIHELEVPDILDRISAVPVNSYTWKREVMGEQSAKKEVLGLIAQDFHSIFRRGKDTEINGQEVQMALWMGAQQLYRNDREKEEKIIELEKQISDMSAQLEEITELLKTNRQDILLNGGNRPVLGQNYPNPYEAETVIEYFIPKNTRKAEIQFTDIAGKVIKKVELKNLGKGKINLKAQDLPQGSYYYSLLVDGGVVDSKQMVLTR